MTPCTEDHFDSCSVYSLSVGEQFQTASAQSLLKSGSVLKNGQLNVWEEFLKLASITQLLHFPITVPATLVWR